MRAAHVALVVMTSLLLLLSVVAKLRHDPHVVKVIHEVVGVPMKWLPWLAACEFAGAGGLLLGLAWPPPGIAAAVGVVVYFVGAVVAHVRVGDIKGIGTPGVLLLLATSCLITDVLARR